MLQLPIERLKVLQMLPLILLLLLLFAVPFLSTDPVVFEMYFTTGRQPKTMLWTIKTKRGRNKNEAINKIAEASLMTTAKFREEAGNGESCL
jgi:hypothetical protein